MRVALRDSLDELPEIFSRLVLGEASLLDDPVEQLAARTVLGDDVDGRRRRQHLQQLDHGRMLDQLHDRNLQAEACTEKTTEGSDAEQVKRRHGCGSGFPARSASASAAAVRVRSLGDLLLDLFAHVVRTNFGFIKNFNGDKSTRFRVRREFYFFFQLFWQCIIHKAERRDATKLIPLHSTDSELGRPRKGRDGQGP